MINQVLFFFEMRKYASFAEMSMILIIITKAQLLPFVSSNMRYPFSKFYSYKTLFFLINRFFLLWAFFSFLNFLILMTTETIHNLCSFQIKCYIQTLTMMLIKVRVKNYLWAFLNFRLSKEFFLPILPYFLTGHICDIRLT